jgi:hypothetical protein
MIAARFAAVATTDADAVAAGCPATSDRHSGRTSMRCWRTGAVLLMPTVPDIAPLLR